MKNIFLILLIFIILLMSFETAGAVDNMEIFKLQQQIDILNSQIRNLKSLEESTQSKGEVSARAYIAMDAKTKKVILEKNIGQQYPIASVAKLMNAVVTLENINTKTNITLKRNMLKPEGQSPSLFLNSKISVGNLLKASLIQSVNDASQALSFAVGIGRFVKLMNKKAKALGMENTIYIDAHGLSEKNVSTAEDLAELMVHVYQKYPQILSMTKNDDFWLPDVKGKLLKFKNLNHFYAMPNFIGGKTGYTLEARETMVSIFNINDKPVIVVVLHSKDSQTDTLKLIEMVKTAL